jgi:hypothetical protein
MTQTETKSKTTLIDDAVQPVRDAAEHVADLGRKAGTAFLDVYQASVNTFADYQDKLADSSRIDWAAPIGHAHSQAAREVTKLYVTTARDLLK